MRRQHGRQPGKRPGSARELVDAIPDQHEAGPLRDGTESSLQRVTQPCRSAGSGASALPYLRSTSRQSPVINACSSPDSLVTPMSRTTTAPPRLDLAKRAATSESSADLPDPGGPVITTGWPANRVAFSMTSRTCSALPVKSRRRSSAAAQCKLMDTSVRAAWPRWFVPGDRSADSRLARYMFPRSRDIAVRSLCRDWDDPSWWLRLTVPVRWTQIFGQPARYTWSGFAEGFFFGLS
jgi:hypothetical protein